MASNSNSEKNYQQKNQINVTQRLEEYKSISKQKGEDEVYLHCWKDTTLREIVDGIQMNVPVAMKKDLKFIINSIYQDSFGRFNTRLFGEIHTVRKEKDDEATLNTLGFQLGDLLSIKIEKAPEKQNN